MKKIIMIASLITLCSCGNDAPKCDDEDVKKTVISILVENRDNIYSEGGSSVSFFLTGKGTFKNIMTKSIDKEINLCNCEGTYTQEKAFEGNVTYSAQKNSEGEVIVKVENAGPMNFIN
jgi:hypothetical protein